MKVYLWLHDNVKMAGILFTSIDYKQCYVFESSTLILFFPASLKFNKFDFIVHFLPSTKVLYSKNSNRSKISFIT